MRSAIGVAGPPGAAGIFDFDPGLSGAGVAADGEGAVSGLGVDDGVGGELIGDEDDVVGGGAVA